MAPCKQAAMLCPHRGRLRHAASTSDAALHKQTAVSRRCASRSQHHDALTAGDCRILHRLQIWLCARLARYLIFCPRLLAIPLSFLPFHLGVCLSFLLGMCLSCVPRSLGVTCDREHHFPFCSHRHPPRVRPAHTNVLGGNDGDGDGCGGSPLCGGA